MLALPYFVDLGKLFSLSASVIVFVFVFFCFNTVILMYVCHHKMAMSVT